MERFEEIRREFEFGVGTISGVARKLGVHRRMVREAIASALPEPRKANRRRSFKIEPVRERIDAMLESDRHAPPKQRHTAHRIWQRLLAEVEGCSLAERTVRQYVERRRRELALDVREVYVPQSYEWGGEAQVDWYDAYADIAGERRRFHVFCLRSMASGGAFHRAYAHATQQAFLEAHEHAFAYFGGVFRRLRYDNLKAAVKRILRGFQREETARFVAFRSHWRLRAEFCTPGEAHEKGGVEGEGGQFRRNRWVPVPRAGSLAELNEQLLVACRDEERRTITGREQPVGAAMEQERPHLLPLAEESFDLAELSFPAVDGQGCVRVRTNHYSAPVPAGTRVEVRLSAAAVEIRHEDRVLARHERCYERHRHVLDLEHYLDVLVRKPGALAGSKPLEQRRRAGLWPASFDAIWQGLTERHGRPDGTRRMVELLALGKAHGQDALRAAVETALSLGSCDVAAVRHLLLARQLRRPACEAIELGVLERYERPLPMMTSYDQLLEVRLR